MLNLSLGELLQTFCVDVITVIVWQELTVHSTKIIILSKVVYCHSCETISFYLFHLAKRIKEGHSTVAREKKGSRYNCRWNISMQLVRLPGRRIHTTRGY